MLYAFSVLVIFLCVAALFESWTIPFVNLLMLPLGVFGALAATSLRGMPNCYKIKLKALGYRLVYEVVDQAVTVTVIAVGKRERGLIYETSNQRAKN